MDGSQASCKVEFTCISHGQALDILAFVMAKWIRRHMLLRQLQRRYARKIKVFLIVGTPLLIYWSLESKLNPHGKTFNYALAG